MEFRKRKLCELEIEEERQRLQEEGLSDYEEPFEDSGSSFHGSESNSVSFEENESDSDGGESNDAGTTNVDDDGDWTDTSEDPVEFDFIGKEEFLADIDQNITPLQAFSLFFDELLINKIVNWTNERAKTFCENNTKRHSNLKNWENVKNEDIKKFLGLCLATGNIHMPSLKHYWSQNILYKHQFFGSVMSRNKFETILRCICFYNKDDITTNKLHKVNNLLSHLIQNIRNTYSPGINLSLDEALLLWKGRLCFKQYIPNKRARYGVKFYELCTTDGFVINIKMYYGKGTVDNEKGHAYAVVKELMEPYLDKGHTLYMDNFYNSVALCEYLNKHKTHVVGTLRTNRKGNPINVCKKKLKKGECAWKRKGTITIAKWKDKRDVLMISTKHRLRLIEVRNRRGRNISKPNIIEDYNQHMSGVDRCDQMTSYYKTPRKTIRWYMKVFLHLLDVAVWNSCWVYNQINSRNKISYLNFRDKLILDLSGPNSLPLRIQKKDHFPKKLEKRVRCRLCSNKKKRSATWYICDKCCDKENKPIGLCIDPCFAEYHI